MMDDLYGGGTVTTYTYSVDSDRPPPPRFEHDPAGRVFRLTAADGAVESFRDNPTRYLCVEPDPETGAMRRLMKHGRPVYLHLCREDREARSMPVRVVTIIDVHPIKIIDGMFSI
jgi:hypothetical protein